MEGLTPVLHCITLYQMMVRTQNVVVTGDVEFIDLKFAESHVVSAAFVREELRSAT